MGITEDSTVQAKALELLELFISSWDDKLHLWDAGSFCMEETLTGGVCVGDLTMMDSDDFQAIRNWIAVTFCMPIEKNGSSLRMLPIKQI